MNKFTFTIEIPATKETIWKALWDDRLYREWTSIFTEGSHMVVENWEAGSTVLFLGPDKNGMYSEIETHIPNKTITFKHIGAVIKGEKQPVDEEAKTWSGATESYTLTEGKDGITLVVDIDIMDAHIDYMKTTLPKALEIVKKNCV